MWVGITLAVVVELVPSEIKTTAVAAYLFIISNIGGNANLLVPPLAQHFESQHYSKSDSLRCKYIVIFTYLYWCTFLIFYIFESIHSQIKATLYNSKLSSPFISLKALYKIFNFFSLLI